MGLPNRSIRVSLARADDARPGEALIPAAAAVGTLPLADGPQALSRARNQQRASPANATDACHHLPARTLLVSGIVPPHPSGHAALIDQLFRTVCPDDYRVATFDDLTGGVAARARDGAPLPARNLYVRSEWSYSTDPTYPLRRVRLMRRLAAEIASTARATARYCRAEGCEIILATTGTLPRLPSAVLASRMAGVPLVILLWDFWRHAEPERANQWVARLLEPFVYGSAAAVVVPNELLRDAVARVSEAKPVIIRLPAPDDAFVRRPPKGRQGTGVWRVVFTGQVYPAIVDPFRDLLSALEEPGLQDCELHYFGPQSRIELDGLGVTGNLVCHPYVEGADLHAVQQAADSLFLPLAFDGPLRALMYTSSVTKFGEYLASGRPVLIHAPPGAFPAWYAREHECSMVVDVPGRETLARAVRVLRNDRDLGDRIGARGMARAQADFTLAEAQAGLARVLSSAAGYR